MFDHRRRLFLGVALAALSTACATSGAPAAPAVRVDKLTKQDMAFEAVQIEPFTIGPKGVKAQDPEAYLRKAHDVCARVLTKSGLFQTVTTDQVEDASRPFLIVRAQLLTLNLPSSSRQQWLGGLAGTPKMKVEVVFVDGSTGKAIKSAAIEQDAETAGGTWSFGATDRSLPAEVGTRIAELTAVIARR